MNLCLHQSPANSKKFTCKRLQLSRKEHTNVAVRIFIRTLTVLQNDSIHPHGILTHR